MHLSFGTFLELVTLALLLVGTVTAMAIAWRISSGGGGGAVSELSKANEVLEKRIHDLREEYQKKVDELGAQVRDLRVENAELRTRTDYQAVINEHEARASERHGATLKVLELIATRLGPDTASEGAAA